MTQTKTKSKHSRRNHSKNSVGGSATIRPGEVLTLAEAAAYLRVTEGDVLRLVREQGLPGRKVGDDWRFLKAAIADWLRATAVADPAKFWQTHFGALRDDPYLDELLRGIYQRRGRPETDKS